MNKSIKLILNVTIVIIWILINYFYGENNLPSDGGEETGFPFGFLTVYANQLEGGYEYVFNFWYLLIDTLLLFGLLFIMNKFLLKKGGSV